MANSFLQKPTLEDYDVIEVDSMKLKIVHVWWETIIVLATHRKFVIFDYRIQVHENAGHLQQDHEDCCVFTLTILLEFEFAGPAGESENTSRWCHPH